jgi:hypothetical protein
LPPAFDAFIFNSFLTSCCFILLYLSFLRAFPRKAEGESWSTTTINEANFNLNHALELRTIHEINCPMTLRTVANSVKIKLLGLLSKDYSSYARWKKNNAQQKLIIFVGSSPSQGDILFLKSHIKWAFLYILNLYNKPQRSEQPQNS